MSEYIRDIKQYNMNTTYQDAGRAQANGRASLGPAHARPLAWAGPVAAWDFVCILYIFVYLGYLWMYFNILFVFCSITNQHIIFNVALVRAIRQNYVCS